MQIDLKNRVRQWPESLMLVRHGQSAGNVAAEAAEEAGLSLIDIDLRDVDVDLSALGERQAHALGAYIKNLSEAERPTIILCSPYLRAKKTAQIIHQYLENGPEFRFDERLREREFGVIDRYTKKGIKETFPDQFMLHQRLKKFYYRPPGGESWCDVILRLRSVLDTLAIEFSGERVMIVCHSVVIMCFRYLLEQLTEEEILEIDRTNLLANCSLTSYVFDRSEHSLKGCSLNQFNFVAPVEDAGETVTDTPDAKIYPK